MRGLRAGFRLQVALQQFGHVLADQQLAQVLEIGQAVQHEDPLHQLVGMLHLADRLLVLLLAPGGPKPQCLSIR